MGDLALGEMLKTLREITREIARAVALNFGIHDLDFIQDRSHLTGRHRRMIQVVNEMIKCLLKIDVVLPKRVVGIKDQVLACQSVASFRGRVFREPRKTAWSLSAPRRELAGSCPASGA